MISWKDISNYSRSDKVREISIVHADVGPICLSVHRHIHHPGKWLLTVNRGWIDKRELTSENLENAKAEAVKIVKTDIEYILTALTQ